MLRAAAMSLVLLTCVLASETLHLTRRNPFFLSDLDGAAWSVLLYYVAFALALGAIVGAVAKTARVQAFVLAIVVYLVISLKIFWLDAELLTSPRIGVAFVLFTIGTFSLTGYLQQRLRLPETFPLILSLGYANVCLAIASGWGLGGGRLLPFLLSGRTVLVAVSGGIVVVLATVVQRWAETKGGGSRAIVPVTVVAILVATTLVTMRRLPNVRHAPMRDGGDQPDVIILSFDALRSDALASFIASHPDSHAARLAQRVTLFENVVSQGPSTDHALANNTFAGMSRTNCPTSVPGQLFARGYFTAMLYANLGRRFEGSDCFKYYFSGNGASLSLRYGVAALARALVKDNDPLRHGALRAPELLDKLREVAVGERPLYAYLHFLELHAPYVPESDLHDEAAAAVMSEFTRRCYMVACDQSDPNNAKLIAVARAAYTKLLDEVDRAIGSAWQIAEQRGRPFVLVVTADHGELIGEHGGFAHSGGFVPELLDIPFLVFDSREQRRGRRCELMLSSEAIRATALGASNVGAPSYPDHAVLELLAPPLGRARIDKQRASIDYEIAEDVIPHYGTWRNIHREPRGTLSYPIERCLPDLGARNEN
jgi:hypothetical protein